MLAVKKTTRRVSQPNRRQTVGWHNWPGAPTGSFSIRSGPFFAATDQFEVTVVGKGGHGAKPHETIDPIVATAQIVTALQTIASRNADPVDRVVVSVTSIESSSKAYNVIPARVVIRGTIRTLAREMRALAETRFKAICAAVAGALGAEAKIDWKPGYPSMVNAEEQTEFAAEIVARHFKGQGA